MTRLFWLITALIITQSTTLFAAAMYATPTLIKSGSGTYVADVNDNNQILYRDSDNLYIWDDGVHVSIPDSYKASQYDSYMNNDADVMFEVYPSGTSWYAELRSYDYGTAQTTNLNGRFTLGEEEILGFTDSGYKLVYHHYTPSFYGGSGGEGLFQFNAANASTKFTSSEYDQRGDINEAGIHVYGGKYGNAQRDIIRRTPGGAISPLSDTSSQGTNPQINNSNQVAWLRQTSTSGSYAYYSIYLYDPDTGRQLVLENIEMDYDTFQFNDNGYMAWVGNDGDGTDNEIFIFDGSSVIQVTDNDYQDYAMVLSEGNYCTWIGSWNLDPHDTSSDNEVFIWDGAGIQQLSDNTVADYYAHINDNGDVAWSSGGYTSIYLATNSGTFGGSATAVPEPVTTVLISLSLAGLYLRRRI